MAASGSSWGVRRRIRWVLRHEMFRRAVQKRARTGDLGARLILDPELVADPYATYDVLRARDKLVHTGIALTTAHHDVATAVLRSPDFGVSMMDEDALPTPVRLLLRAGGRWPLGPAQPPSMLVVDPPDHTRIRRLVTRAFSARRIAALRSRTEEVAAALLDELAAEAARDGSVDLVGSYASLLPATVIVEVLGAPVDMRSQFLEWGEGGALSLDAGLTYRQFRRTERDIDALHAWMLGHFDRIRRDPGPDLLSALVAAHDEDGALSDDELSSVAMLLLAAGFETTVNLVGSGASLLMRHADQLERLRAEPELWPTAVDEMLRIESPVQRTGRVARRDTDVLGHPVRAGAAVIVLLGGVNRDPAVFPDPDRFDVGRAEAGEHLAFSSGAHYCVGAGLARMEGEVALRALVERFPDLAPAGPGRLRPTRVLRGYDRLPVRLTPVPAGAGAPASAGPTPTAPSR